MRFLLGQKPCGNQKGWAAWMSATTMRGLRYRGSHVSTGAQEAGTAKGKNSFHALSNVRRIHARMAARAGRDVYTFLLSTSFFYPFSSSAWFRRSCPIRNPSRSLTLGYLLAVSCSVAQYFRSLVLRSD